MNMNFIELQIDEAFKDIEAKTDLIEEIEMLLASHKMNTIISSLLIKLKISARFFLDENKAIKKEIQIRLDKLNKL